MVSCEIALMAPCDVEAPVPPRATDNCASTFNVPFAPDVYTTPLVVRLPTRTAVEAEFPIVTVPVEVPVLIFVSKLEELLSETAAPLTVSPRLPVNNPADVIAPEPVVEIFPDVESVPLLVIDNCPLDPNKTFPVEVLPIEIVPLPFAFNVKFSFVPDDITSSAAPPPAAAAVTFKPVADEAVLVSTCKAGLVKVRPMLSADVDWFSVLTTPSPTTLFATNANADETNCFLGVISPSKPPPSSKFTVR